MSCLPVRVAVTGVTGDSRQVREGFLFAALPGQKLDGRNFIAEALAKGAAAILAERGTLAALAQKPAVPVVEVENPRRALALAAAEFFGAQPETVVTVTGTNGKTSTVSFVRQLWQQRGVPGASLGTLGLSLPAGTGLKVPAAAGAAHTTPDPVQLHETLAFLAQEKIQHLAMEASSHGLHQHRLDGVRFAAGGFTNLTRDHIDYHGTMENYFAAKTRLFSDLLPKGAGAVINADVPEGKALARIAAERHLRLFDYGQNAGAIRLLARRPVADGQDVTLEVQGTRHDLRFPLVGAFQLMNALCALGLVLAEEDSAPARAGFLEGLARLEGVRGRMEKVAATKTGGVIYVDYAHTPDGLQNVLQALRPHTQGKLVCVMGCGGDRDRGKRPIMGKIAATLADAVIVTDDNPRSENPAAIRQEIMAGCPQAEDIGDRASAIRAAVALLEKGDILVIAGKGHEQGQIVGSEILPFDDAAEARLAAEAVTRKDLAS